MASHLCCTAQRCMTPTQPIFKRTIKPGTRTITSDSDIPDSRYASTRTEDLLEIQELFDPPNLADSAASIPDEHSLKSSTDSSKHSKLTNFFRRRLSHQFSKSKKSLQTDPEKLKQAKQEISSTLLSNDDPEAGGYDTDARMLENVDEPATPTKVKDEATRGRSRYRGQSIEHEDWFVPIVEGRLSISLSPPRISFGSHARARRSHSMTSLHSVPDTPTLYPIRLPSFSAERDTSRNWRRGVMESLHIDSPSTSALIPTPIRVPTRRQSKANNWPLRETVITPVDSEAPLVQTPEPLQSVPDGAKNSMPDSARPSEEVSAAGWSKPSLELRAASHLGSSSSSGGRAHFFGRPERRPNRSSAASIHLYNMGISRHLRSMSSLNAAVVRSHSGTQVPSAVPTRAHTPVQRYRQPSNSGFISEDMGAVKEPSRTHLAIKKDCASSTYSTAPNSPAGSSLDLQRISCDGPPKIRSKGNLRLHIDETPLPSSSRCSSSGEIKTTPITLPDNPSNSNLSDKSSKVSKFKENFDNPDAKKSRKRSSIVNLFNKTLRRKSASLESFDESYDGTVDQPRRLERAMALTDRADATGLMAKAIRDKQAEKSAMYLNHNKEAAMRDVFRQRSSSFCRPLEDSVSGIQKPASALMELGPTREWHRRSTSEGFLKPEAAMEQFSSGGLPRPRSTGHLTPTFNTPNFATPSFKGKRPDSPSRAITFDVDPLDASPTLSRRPSFKLNDQPAVLQTPPISFNYPPPTTAGYGFPKTSVDLEDPNLDLGPWSRYPSHTREQRTGSAGIKDDVKTRDFAYDINPSAIVIDSDNEAEDLKSKKKGKKRRKRTGKLPKSKSMNIGKEFLRGYSKLFRSSSVEWMGHGKGHRSSISAGGALEHPELEILPPIFAPMPIIPDTEKDAGLEHSKTDIELTQIKRKRADHGKSIVDRDQMNAALHSHSPHTHGHHLHPHHLDGASDVKNQEPRRNVSSPELVCPTTSGNAEDSALAYARHFESCVYLPPPTTSHSTSSRHLNIHTETDIHYHTTGASSCTDTVDLIDKMLSSQPTSNNVSPMPSPLMTPMTSTTTSRGATMPRSRHGHGKSVGSVNSLRASSMDLLKTLKQAEERERQRALEGLLSKARQSMNEERGRKVSSESGVSSLTASTSVYTREEFGDGTTRKVVVREYEVPGVLGHGRGQRMPSPLKARSASPAVHAH